ncbi:protein ABSCISIC ACID-INSENSITIVE 5 isoform X1 [Quercus lobata]|uniref:BZIP domain-containing protein n=1 Tax=Quercus lobata TaxID=97700 RepID=A0A7N2M858_QUELO|nr:protein ABSCISIC ACID-INSENSITIVE 5 isoform X1 [Quercus lobata]XP_030925408.1 protein ABSCISIC ACID-INSENSITIVE 5 isoform X1 [Quercus lobata]
MANMVVTESDMISHGEVDSPLQHDQQPNNDNNKNNPFSSLGRQSSIYSLTLDEFQHTLCESGKNFGSMNMDEFLNSIWTAEENQVVTTTTTTTTVTTTTSFANNNNNNMSSNPFLAPSKEHSDQKGMIAKQPSLPRQGSLTLPAPLCRKTVDEVWSEIRNKGQEGQHQNSSSNISGNSNDGDNVQNPESAPRQPTFGEMTLEDFLIKAGVVRESCTLPAIVQLQPQPQQQYGVYQNNNPTVGHSFVNRPLLGLGGGAGGGAGGSVVSGGGGGGVGSSVSVSTYQAMSQGGGGGGGGIGESSGYAGNGKRSGGGYPPPPPPTVCFGGRVVNGGGGPYGAAPAMGPVSPVSSDGRCTTQVDNTSQFGLEMGGMRGRKRIIDGPVEKVVERRQRRMIKNRESAARSRARKQAYTVELEAELNQLREENTHLKQALVELERKRKQQYLEEMKTKVHTKAQKAKEKLRMLRRNLSFPL